MQINHQLITPSASQTSLYLFTLIPLALTLEISCISINYKNEPSIFRLRILWHQLSDYCQRRENITIIATSAVNDKMTIFNDR